MSRLRACIAAIALSASGCTIAGVGGGALYASTKNGDPEVQQGTKPRTSYAKSMLVGAAIGLVLDIGFATLSVYESGGPGH